MASKTYGTAARRWEGVGPYYAMFPTRFADEVVRRYTEPGDAVLDPFAGRGTAVFSADHQGRSGYGIEICPVGWIYASTKLQPATKACVMHRLRDLVTVAPSYAPVAASLPEFFEWCFAPAVRDFLVAAREELDWRKSRVDRTLMAFLLIYLHGKREAALSNQMRQTKAMAPKYAVRWWQERDLKPPDVEILPFLAKRIAWRYAKGVPEVSLSSAYLGDSQVLLPRIQRHLSKRHAEGIRLLLTSPPYFGVTNYHYDQWLRLWLLGGPATDARIVGTHELQGKFEHPVRYAQLLADVFAKSAELMAPTGTVYVRTGAQQDTLMPTIEALKLAFPNHRIRRRARPYSNATQTQLFTKGAASPGEIDLVVAVAR
jgi:DNA methylase